MSWRIIPLRRLPLTRLIAASGLLASAAVAFGDVVTLRGGARPLDGTVVAMDGAGLSLRASGSETVLLLPWQIVADVAGPQAGAFSDRYASMSTAVWRIEARWMRGDYESAELLYESLASTADLQVASGATRRRMLQTVMGVRLARGFVTGGLKAFIETLALPDELSGNGLVRQAAGDAVPGGDGFLPVAVASGALDPRMGLCPNLPPAMSPALLGGTLRPLGTWAGWEDSLRLLTARPGAGGLAGQVAGGAGAPPAPSKQAVEAAAIISWYRAEAQCAAGKPDALLGLAIPELAADATASGSAGPTTAEQLVRVCVVAARGNKDQRRLARAWLGTRLSGEFKVDTREIARSDSNPSGGQPAIGRDGKPLAEPASERAWQEAWCRLAIGRSLLAEDDAQSRKKGVLELLHLPALFASRLPIPTALALAEAAAELQRTGDVAGAEALRADLRRILPGIEAAPESPENAPSDAASIGAGGSAPALGTTPGEQRPSKNTKPTNRDPNSPENPK